MLWRDFLDLFSRSEWLLGPTVKVTTHFRLVWTWKFISTHPNISLHGLTTNFITCTRRQIHDQVKEDEMGTACSMNGGEEECI
jgi:hypothetical protein